MQWRRQLWGTEARAPHKLEKANKLSDEIIMQTNETMLNICYIKQVLAHCHYSNI
jgi:hypothetical protein